MFRRIDDTISMDVNDQQATIFSQIPELLDSVGIEQGDRGYAVLHRPLYPDPRSVDPEVEALVSRDLEAQRTADRFVLERCTQRRCVLTLDEAGALLRSLNEARLVLAARAGAFEEGPAWEQRVDTDPALAAVAWLGYVQAELIGVLTLE